MDRRHYYHENREKLLEYARQYRLDNKERLLIQEKARRQALKLETFSVYSNNKVECACCGEEHLEFLALDHVNGGGNQARKELKKIHRATGDKLYAYLKQNNYPPGFRVLCHNCNHSFGHYNYCPHQM